MSPADGRRLPRTAAGRLSASGNRSGNGACETLGSPGGRPVAGRSATLESGRDGGGQDEHERRISARSGWRRGSAAAGGTDPSDAGRAPDRLGRRTAVRRVRDRPGTPGVPGVRQPGASRRRCLSRPRRRSSWTPTSPRAHSRACSRSGSPRNRPGSNPCSRSVFGCCTASGPGGRAVRLEAAD